MWSSYVASFSITAFTNLGVHGISPPARWRQNRRLIWDHQLTRNDSMSPVFIRGRFYSCNMIKSDEGSYKKSCTHSEKVVLKNILHSGVCIHYSHCLLLTSPDLSMVPLSRIALFQSFRVDFPAKHTNSFGLMSCSLNWSEGKEKQVSVDSGQAKCFKNDCVPGHISHLSQGRRISSRSEWLWRLRMWLGRTHQLPHPPLHLISLQRQRRKYLHKNIE